MHAQKGALVNTCAAQEFRPCQMSLVISESAFLPRNDQPIGWQSVERRALCVSAPAASGSMMTRRGNGRVALFARRMRIIPFQKAECLRVGAFRQTAAGNRDLVPSELANRPQDDAVYSGLLYGGTTGFKARD